MIALQQQLQDIAAGLNRLSFSRTEIQLREARALARGGYYSDAQRTLESIKPENQLQQAEALDLLARVFAQQARFDKARTYWKHLLQADPENRDAIAGLAEINRAANRAPSPTGMDKAATALAVVAALAAIITYGEWRYHSATRELHLADGIIQKQLIAMDGRFARQEEHLQKLRGENLAALDRSHGDLTNELKASLIPVNTRLTTLTSQAGESTKRLADLEKANQELAREVGTANAAGNQVLARHTAAFERIDTALKILTSQAGETTLRLARLDSTVAEATDVIGKSHQSALNTQAANVENMGRLLTGIEALSREVTAIHRWINPPPSEASESIPIEIEGARE